MREYLEATITLFPTSAGGRRGAVTPREGNYLPSIEIFGLPRRFEVKLIEGPVSISPGEDGVVVMHLTSPAMLPAAAAGTELTIYEKGRAVGIGQVLRLW